MVNIPEYMSWLVMLPVCLAVLAFAWVLRGIVGHDISLTLRGLGVTLEVKSSGVDSAVDNNNNKKDENDA